MTTKPVNAPLFFRTNEHSAGSYVNGCKPHNDNQADYSSLELRVQAAIDLQRVNGATPLKLPVTSGSPTGRLSSAQYPAPYVFKPHRGWYRD